MSIEGYAREKVLAAVGTMATHQGAVHARLEAAMGDLAAASAGAMPDEETRNYLTRIWGTLTTHKTSGGQADVRKLTMDEAKAVAQDIWSLGYLLLDA